MERRNKQCAEATLATRRRGEMKERGLILGGHKKGRPTKYDPKYCEEIVNYFDKPRSKIIKRTKSFKDGRVFEEEYEVANPLPLFGMFAHKIGVNKDTIVEWAKVHPDFSVAYTRAKDIQKAFLIENGLKGLYDSKFAIFVAKNVTDMRDTQTHDVGEDSAKQVLDYLAGRSLGLPRDRKKE
jgi:hypothetical protein